MAQTDVDSEGLLTPERILIRESARDFTLNEVLPVANRLDPVEGEIPLELRAKLADMGYFGIRIPEEYGGSGLGCFEYCLVAEQLARGWMSVASIMARGNGTLTMDLLNAEQKARLLPRVVTGDYLGAMSLSEPDTGSDLASIACRAEREGDGWRITGNKYWCTFADGADYIVLFARTGRPDPERPHLGISAFLIDKPRGELPAGVQGSPIPKIGYFGWKTWELAFDGVRLPGTALIGEEGKAFYALAKGLDEARAHTAARSIGLAQGALEDAINYAHQRTQFGRPIAAFQDLRF
ncbi:MAG: acyl-CoA dehydrogenase family protein, partial [Gammaproteobacteria bacterium]